MAPNRRKSRPLARKASALDMLRAMAEAPPQVSRRIMRYAAARA